MAYTPPVGPSSFTQEEVITLIAEAEAAMLQNMVELFCDATAGLVGVIQDLATTDPQEAVDLTHKLMCAYACKEKSIGLVLEGLAAKICADKGLCPGNGDGDSCGDCC